MYFEKKNINLKTITAYIIPVIVLLIAGVSLVLAQWIILNNQGYSFKVGEPAPETTTFDAEEEGHPTSIMHFSTLQF